MKSDAWFFIRTDARRQAASGLHFMLSLAPPAAARSSTRTFTQMTIMTSVFAVAALLSAIIASPALAACPFSRMPVKIGMPRLELETRIAEVLEKANTYSPYGNNLLGGTVSYRSGNCELRVTFAPGVPAPRVIVASGGTEHLPPIDESVLSYRVVPTPSKQQN